MKNLKANTLKILLSALIAILITLLCPISSGKAYAYIKDPVSIINPGGGGAAREKLTLHVMIHNSEIKNFATITEGTIQGYNSIIFPTVSRPAINSNFNKLDNIIYMIKKLEAYAEPLSYASRMKLNNLVLGYIRGINNNYTGKNERSSTTIFDKSTWGFDYWQVIAGYIDCSFATKVQLQEYGEEISLSDFFGSYLNSKEDYNSFLNYSSSNNYILGTQKLSDPLDSYQNIDLIHMIASIDGIYQDSNHNDTICKIMLGNAHFQRDLVSWLGDLQTLAQQMAVKDVDVSKLKNYSFEMGHIDFNNFIGNQTDTEITNFSSEDLLADIDAFNITNFFLNFNINSLSDSIIGYYTTVNKDGAEKGNRYSSFIYNVTLELNQPSTGNRELDFINEVCNAMNVKYENGEYTDCKYFSGYNVELLGEAKNRFDIRKYCAKLFCDYIISMSHGN